MNCITNGIAKGFYVQSEDGKLYSIDLEEEEENQMLLKNYGLISHNYMK